MLVLSRRQQESIRISDNIIVTVLEIQRNKVRIGIDAPKEIPVLRTELENGFLIHDGTIAILGPQSIHDSR